MLARLRNGADGVFKPRLVMIERRALDGMRRAVVNELQRHAARIDDRLGTPDDKRIALCRRVLIVRHALERHGEGIFPRLGGCKLALITHAAVRLARVEIHNGTALGQAFRRNAELRPACRLSVRPAVDRHAKLISLGLFNDKLRGIGLAVDLHVVRSEPLIVVAVVERKHHGIAPRIDAALILRNGVERALANNRHLLISVIRRRIDRRHLHRRLFDDIHARLRLHAVIARCTFHIRRKLHRHDVVARLGGNIGAVLVLRSLPAYAAVGDDDELRNIRIAIAFNEAIKLRAFKADAVLFAIHAVCKALPIKAELFGRDGERCTALNGHIVVGKPLIAAQTERVLADINRLFANNDFQTAEKVFVSPDLRCRVMGEHIHIVRIRIKLGIFTRINHVLIEQRDDDGKFVHRKAVRLAAVHFRKRVVFDLRAAGAFFRPFHKRRLHRVVARGEELRCTAAVKAINRNF